MPSVLELMKHRTPSSGAGLGRVYRVGGYVRASGYAAYRRLRLNQYVTALAAPIQSPAGSQSGRQIESYIRGYVTQNVELPSAPARPAGVSSSPLAWAERMSPWEAKNRRRIRLIDKKYNGGLSIQEAAELTRLKREVAAHMEIIAPRTGDVLDEQAARIAKLKIKKALAKKGNLG